MAAEDDAPATEGLDKSLTQLENKWVIWYDNPGGRVGQRNWFDNMKRIIIFDKGEDFWCAWNNILPPSQLQNGSNYHMFKEGIDPMWEDKQNVKGGKWVIQFPKGRKDAVDEYWLHSLLALLGEALDDSHEVNGCVVSVRKNQSKLSVWTKTASDEEACMRIGTQLREILGLEEGWKIGYVAHQDSINEKMANRYELS